VIGEPLRWRGEFVYLADAATFTDCASGLRWPVAMAGDYLAAQQRYTQLRGAPGAPLVVAFDGRLDMRPAMEGPPREHIVVDRFGGAEPGASCNTPLVAQGTAPAPLKDTDWKLVELDGKAVVKLPTQQREVRLTLAGSGTRAFGFSGCNQFTGGYEHDGANLRFKQMAATMMACSSPFMELETQFLKMLGSTFSYRIEGQRLMLLSGELVHARFDAGNPR
jgi:heat shock protein HslJ